MDLTDNQPDQDVPQNIAVYAEALSVLHGMIRNNGPLSLPAYLQFCLAHPRFGYYRHNVGIGAAGDFITAPEVTPLFGETIAIWVYLSWQELGKPKTFCLCECGPGRGTLFTDVMKALRRLDSEMVAQIHPVLVEISTDMMKQQQNALKDIPRIKWVSSISRIPKLPTILIANEFLDVLPIRQWKKQQNAWYQRYVDAVPGKQELVPRFLPCPARLSPLPDINQDRVRDGIIYETSPWRDRWFLCLLRMLNSQSGAALLIDYGYGSLFEQVQFPDPDLSGAQKSGGDTLQALSRHKFVSLWQQPGHVDITSHVDFDRLADHSLGFPAQRVRVRSQADFLAQYGFHDRAMMWSKRSQPKLQETIARQVQRLCAPEQMGTLFKVMDIITSVKH